MAEIIDAHHHLWHYKPADYGWIGPEMEVLQRDFLAHHFEDEMHAAGVQGSVVVQAKQTLAETEWLLQVADRAPCIWGVVGWVPLAEKDLPLLLEQFHANPKLKGVRHCLQDEADDTFILREDFNRGIHSLLHTGLVYDILIHERHLPHAVAFLSRHPEQVFVLDHLAKPLVRDHAIEPWRKNLQYVANHENVYCKLSGLVTEAHWDSWTLDDLRPYLDVALETFGADRLMVGSDWPVCLVASSYTHWWSAIHEWCRELSSSERESILGANARRVYRLTPPSGPALHV